MSEPWCRVYSCAPCVLLQPQNLPHELRSDSTHQHLGDASAPQSAQLLRAQHQTSPPFTAHVSVRFRRHWLSRNKTKPRWFPRPCPRVSILTRWQSCVLTVAPSLRRQLRSRRRSPCPQVALAPSWHPLQPADTKRRTRGCGSRRPLCPRVTSTQRAGSPSPNAAHPKPNNNTQERNLLSKPSKSGRRNSRLRTQTSP